MKAARILGIAFSASAVLMLGSVECAARNSGRKIGEIERKLSPSAARCMIARRPGDITAWLNTLPGSRAEKEVLKSADVDFVACFGNYYGESISWKSSYNYPLVRAGVVRALLQAARDDLPTEFPLIANANWYRPLQDEVESKEVQSSILANEMGFCLAKKNWMAVRGMILAVDPEMERREFFINSSKRQVMRQEDLVVNAEIEKVVPHVAGCVPAGVKLAVSRPMLRAILEETAYHATNASKILSGGLILSGNRYA